MWPSQPGGWGCVRGLPCLWGDGQPVVPSQARRTPRPTPLHPRQSKSLLPPSQDSMQLEE